MLKLQIVETVFSVRLLLHLERHRRLQLTIDLPNRVEEIGVGMHSQLAMRIPLGRERLLSEATQRLLRLLLQRRWENLSIAKNDDDLGRLLGNRALRIAELLPDGEDNERKQDAVENAHHAEGVADDLLRDQTLSTVDDRMNDQQSGNGRGRKAGQQEQRHQDEDCNRQQLNLRCGLVRRSVLGKLGRGLRRHRRVRRIASGRQRDRHRLRAVRAC